MHAVIVGVLASRDPSGTEPFPLPDADYFITSPYPIIFEDSFTVGTPTGGVGNLFGAVQDEFSMPTPSILGGVLEESIVFKNYSDGLVEHVFVGTPTVLGGTLQTSVAFQTYNEPDAVESMSVQMPQITDVTLVQTIEFVNYNNGLLEDFAINPTIISGTLS